MIKPSSLLAGLQGAEHHRAWCPWCLSQSLRATAGGCGGAGGVPAGWELLGSCSLLGSGPSILAISSYNSIFWALVQSALMLITFRSAQLESFSPATSLVAAHEVRDGKKEMTGLISCNKETLLYWSKHSEQAKQPICSLHFFQATSKPHLLKLHLQHWSHY